MEFIVYKLNGNGGDKPCKGAYKVSSAWDAPEWRVEINTMEELEIFLLRNGESIFRMTDDKSNAVIEITENS